MGNKTIRTFLFFILVRHGFSYLGVSPDTTSTYAQDTSGYSQTYSHYGLLSVAYTVLTPIPI